MSYMLLNCASWTIVSHSGMVLEYSLHINSEGEIRNKRTKLYTARFDPSFVSFLTLTPNFCPEPTCPFVATSLLSCSFLFASIEYNDHQLIKEFI